MPCVVLGSGVATLLWNQWQLWCGIGGNFRAEYATNHGTVLKATGVGSFDTDPHAAGLFTEILTIIEKDGQPGPFGQLFAFGSFDFAQNIGSAEYNGEVCD